ncbi:MAG TPA: hypothetical protein VM639_20970 [Dongiaceae bacterium]|nr:hypothetical protein [Dongiaceae bacterium]
MLINTGASGLASLLGQQGTGGSAANRQRNIAASADGAQQATSNASAGYWTKAITDSPAVKNFQDYMKKTPEQRMRDAWLAAHHLSEADLDAMPADKRQAIENQMANDIKNRIQNAAQSKAAGDSTTGLAKLLSSSI